MRLGRKRNDLYAQLPQTIFVCFVLLDCSRDIHRLPLAKRQLASIVAASYGAFMVVQAWLWLNGIVSDPASNAVQFGEYLRIPGFMASVLLGTLLVFPFVLGLPWAARRAQSATA